MIHAKRVTRMPRDLHLAICMPIYDKRILDGSTPGKPKPLALGRTYTNLIRGPCEIEFTLLSLCYTSMVIVRFQILFFALKYDWMSDRFRSSTISTE